MKDDGRLKSLGILLAMIAVIVAFFAMFQRRPEEPLFIPVERSAENSAKTGSESKNAVSTQQAESASAGTKPPSVASTTDRSTEPPSH